MYRGYSRPGMIREGLAFFGFIIAISVIIILGFEAIVPQGKIKSMCAESDAKHYYFSACDKRVKR